MAISAAIGVGKKIVGKAINVAKKKKKDLETKGRRVKSALNKKGKTADIPDVAAGAAASTIQTGSRTFRNIVVHSITTTYSECRTSYCSVEDSSYFASLFFLLLFCVLLL